MSYGSPALGSSCCAKWGALSIRGAHCRYFTRSETVLLVPVNGVLSQIQAAHENWLWTSFYIQKHHVGSLKLVMKGIFTTEISKHYKSWLVSFFLKSNYYALISTPLAIAFNSNLGTTFKSLLTQAPNKRIFSVLYKWNANWKLYLFIFSPHIYNRYCS